ncbi:MAG: antiviral reverse transcriptase Drt3a, partial [Microbacterium sp.]
MKAIPYTLRSFIELAESENRRGKDISRYDVNVARANRRLRDARQRFLANFTQDHDDESDRIRIRDDYRVERRELRQNRDRAVEAVLHRARTSFESKLATGAFTFALKPGPVIAGKPTYQIDSALDIAFPAKQAADAVKWAAHIEAPSRNSIIRALQTALKKRYQHVIYKVDVREFFESIPHATLLDRLAIYPNMDSITTQLVKRLLVEYELLHGSAVGLPRGVGLSSHLAELYLNQFDSILKTHPGVLFYARYVDDVVIVLEDEKALAGAKEAVAAELALLQLALNEDKTRELTSESDGDYAQDQEIEYLGYRFGRSAGKLATGLTANRKERRLRRLEQAMQSWLDTAPNAVWPNHGNNGLLLDRIRYLAGNTKLINSKSNVAIGLYFSNSALDTDAQELADL